MPSPAQQISASSKLSKITPEISGKPNIRGDFNLVQAINLRSDPPPAIAIAGQGTWEVA